MFMKEFINNLKRDKARGELAPHQIILLISLQKLYMENRTNIIKIEELINTFSLVWKENQNNFKTKNCNIGMPLKVFLNKEYLEIEINDDISDFRSKTELMEKINKIIVSQILLNLFKSTELVPYLKTRFRV